MSDDPLDREVAFGKYKTATWRQVLDRDPEYVRWVAGEATHSSVDDELREALEMALEDDEWAF